MFIPPEICGKIADEIRDNSLESQRHKKKKEWDRENETLVALTLVSRTWMREAIRALWSEIFITERKTVELSDASASRILGLLRDPETHYATFLRRLVILHPDPSFGLSTVSAGLASTIQQIISISTQVQCLRIYCVNRTTLVLNHLSSLRFPRLRTLRLGVLQSNKEEQQHLATFLLAHPRLQETRIKKGFGLFDWSSLQKSNPLPELEWFEGRLSQLRLLSSSQHLQRVKCVNEVDTFQFISELSYWSNPFAKVTHLTISSAYIPFVADVVRALGKTFPSLQRLSGVQISPDFLTFMGSKLEDLSRCLPQLRQLYLTETKCGKSHSMSWGDAFLTADDESMKNAFSALRRLFPAIEFAQNYRRNRFAGASKTMKFFYSSTSYRAVLTEKRRSSPEPAVAVEDE
ncbi:hypothetical protein SISSUDRAFT_1066741 [Sistotremastrum suecicum HHB10207 ss-3]|uniref:F-box domain-containing protein n=1 Tax=Sistotremastrum suecicum HHB10207 ss-3 TaxID=1314776 RepID=A0A165XYB2_9AGAM|nr:hypothetical protein SISSUDRAFT_1066741 [Sistotremastrum suecicum HHB10207 ss-3]